MSIYSIYRITNLIDSKIYIGFTSQNPNSRWNVHLSTARNLNRKCSYVHLAMRKHGIDNFKFDIIYQSKEKEHTLSIMEQFFIDESNSKTPNGYNIAKGGSATMLGRTGAASPHYGKKHTKEHNKKIADAGIGKTPSNETLIKLSKAKSKENHPLYGVHRTAEQKEKQSFRMTGSNNPMFGKIISEESKLKKKNSLLFRKLVKCPYCDKESLSLSNMKRYHFDKCKLNRFKFDHDSIP